ncbi:hypothetical protein [Flavisphingomonas formosensis]|uniref:hypothetical protein n=1 Tax=Flavisphingomonas formosensis TaxID=861534 RepID=UPI0012FC727A|nr:hypothetical protein [Sphingomonas formosensis]
MEHGDSLRDDVRVSDLSRLNPLSPWVSGFLRDATEQALEEMWALGAENVCGYRDDAYGGAARRLIAAIEDELRRRGSHSLLLPENIDAVLAQQRLSPAVWSRQCAA